MSTANMLRDLADEISTLQERAVTAEEELENCRAELDGMVTPADQIRSWAERRAAMGLSLCVEELARDIEEKVWEFRK